MHRTIICAIVTAAAALPAAPAFAYVGPGAGLSMLGALWGLLVAVIAALAFVVAWPVRRMFRKSRAQQAGDSPSDANAQATAAESEQPGQASVDGQGRS